MGQKNNKGNKKPNNNGYFQQNIQKHGEFFTEKLNARDIQNDYRRILRDIAFNPGNTHQFTRYFMDYTFVQNLFGPAEQEMMKRYYTHIGLSTYLQQCMYYGVQQNPRFNIEYYIAEARKEFETYSLIIEKLNGIISWLTSGNPQEIIFNQVSIILEGLASSLSKYKYYI